MEVCYSCDAPEEVAGPVWELRTGAPRRGRSCAVGGNPTGARPRSCDLSRGLVPESRARPPGAMAMLHDVKQHRVPVVCETLPAVIAAVGAEVAAAFDERTAADVHGWSTHRHTR